MPIKSRYNVDIPAVSLPTYLFGSPDGPLPQTPLFIDAASPDKYLTKSTFRLWCQRFAAGLRADGLQDGDRVLIFSGNTCFFPVVIIGTIMAGGVFSGCNPTVTARELAYQLHDTGAKYLLTHEASVEIAAEAARRTRFPESSVYLFDDGYATFEGRGRDQGAFRHWTHLLTSEDIGRNFRWDEPSPEEVKTRTVALNYSSGTTGVPKGVEITAYNYIANGIQRQLQESLSKDYDAYNKRSKLLCFLPMYHAMAQTIFGINSLMKDTPVYIMPKFDFIKMLEYVQRYSITSLVLVPPILVAIAKYPHIRDYDLSSVERVGSGAAPLGPEICREFERLWPPGKINVKQGWGMTEVTCSAMGFNPDVYSGSNSCGELNANVEAMVVDEAGNELPQGQRGELYVRGPNITKGYWRKPEATAETLTDGWLKTGDIGYCDKELNWFIVDRKKELIKVKGNQVAPAELEGLLLEHKDVTDVAVIGVAKGLDEAPRAYLVLRQGVEASDAKAGEIYGWLAKQVAPFKKLDGGIKFLDAIPKNPSGKILRKVLRDQAKAEEQGVKARL